MINRLFTILFTMTPAFNPYAGGVQQTTFKLGRYFTQQGHDVHYFSMAVEGHKKNDYGTLHVAKVAGGQSSAVNNSILIEVIDKIKPDVVINQMPYEEKMRTTLALARDTKGFLLLGCLRNALFSVKRNIADYARTKLPFPMKGLSSSTLIQYFSLALHKRKHSKDLRAIIDAHDNFILLTPSNRMELEWFIGKYKQHKIKVIPNSIPSVVETKDTFPSTIVHVGRLNTKQKRSDLLIPLWEKLVDRLPDWEFIIVGDGPYKETMEREISYKSLERIKLVGYADPEPYYKNASLFVMTSSFEGFPNVLLEAQSYGLVPFAFDSYPALRDIIDDGKNGFAVSAFDTDIMAAKIVELIAKEEAVVYSSESALANAREYTTNKIGSEWQKFFSEQID